MRRNTMKQSLPRPCLEHLQFRPCPCREFLNPAGQCFEPDPSDGEGYYWYYEKPGFYAVAIMDLTPKEDFIMEYRQSDYLSVNYYDTVSAEELLPYKRLAANCIRGHVSHGDLFRARYHKNMPIRGTEVMMMPGFYHDYLQQEYPGEFSDPEQAFISIDGTIDFPELILLMKQIGKFKGSSMATDLYYTGKVAEALSLIIQRSRQSQNRPVNTDLSQQDRINLDAVKSYIEDHFAFDIKAEQLSAIACMGQTKLRTCFKQAYGVTITEYIRNRRLAYAEYLLIKTDFNITQIAEAVGYHHSGRFSGLFKKNTGLFPKEYRKLMK